MGVALTELSLFFPNDNNMMPFQDQVAMKIGIYFIQGRKKNNIVNTIFLSILWIIKKTSFQPLNKRRCLSRICFDLWDNKFIIWAKLGCLVQSIIYFSFVKVRYIFLIYIQQGCQMTSEEERQLSDNPNL